jgi:hypothetical protein
MKKSRELVGLQSSIGDASKPLAEGCYRSPAGKLAESAQLALKDEEFKDMIPIYYPAAILNNHDHKNGIDDPKSYTAATESLLTKKWDTAMKEELEANAQQQGFRDFVKIGEGRKALRSHWLWTIKHDGAGDVGQFKARPVCVRNHQIVGVDYQATYSPTAHLGHVILPLDIAAKYNFKIHHMDVFMAVLGVDLEEKIYMHPLQGYFRLLQQWSLYKDPRSKSSQKVVLRLRKSLYGAKHSSHIWYSTFKESLICIEFVASHVDRGLFVLHDKENPGIVVAAVVL